MCRVALALCLLLPSYVQADPIISIGMTLDEATEILDSVGASRFGGAYPLPWSGNLKLNNDDSIPEWVPHGHHVYYHLPDNTCLSIRVEVHPNHKPADIIGFELGSTGERYPGKFQWYAAGDAGLHSYPDTIDLALFDRPISWQRNGMAVFVCLVLLMLIQERRQRMSVNRC